MTTQQLSRQWFDDLLQKAQEIKPFVTNLPLNCTLPDRKREAWRYTDLSHLYQQMFSLPDRDAELHRKISFNDWIYAANESYRVVLVNGVFRPDLSLLPEQPSVTLAPITSLNEQQQQLMQQYLLSTVEFNQDAFDELNRSLSRESMLLHIGSNTVLDKPIEIVHLHQPGSSNALNSIRSLVLMEKGAEATIVERFEHSDDSVYFFNGLTRIELQENAKLSHYRLQQQSSAAYHLDRVYLNQHACSHYRATHIATGALWSRSDTVCNLNGQNAECYLSGLYTVGDKQYNDMHIDVRHLQPHCSSREEFKGILYGVGRAVFDGRILVEQDAQKSDAALSNKNLMLVENAEVDTKPQLEIYADDVKCSHGTTVGKIDQDQLFYCQARGIEPQRARQLLCLGFAGQVISDIDDSALFEKVQQQINDVLSV